MGYILGVIYQADRLYLSNTGSRMSYSTTLMTRHAATYGPRQLMPILISCEMPVIVEDQHMNAQETRVVEIECEALQPLLRPSQAVRQPTNGPNH
jgi:hypothetical protein